MPSLFSIRPARPSDLAALLPLFEELDEVHRRVRPDLFHKPIGARREAASLLELVTQPQSIVTVADGGAEGLLGLAVFVEKFRAASHVCRERRIVELDQLVVAASARRRGVGRALFASGKVWGKSRGLADLEVSVWSFNEQAADFYRAMGFEPLVARLATPL